jgi:murein DD-endopeptidase MepM/ murein hydrolase activator NlpD
VLRRLARRPANSRCARWYVGRYDEVRRNMYTTEMFENATKAIDGYAGIRDVHIGLDIGGPAGTPVFAPAEGVIQSFGYNPEAGDYGHVIVTEHDIGGVRCWM